MATPQPTPGAQPKIVQKLLVRTALFLALMAAVFGGIRYVQSFGGDFDRGGESVGLVSAIRIEENGQQAVIVKPDGTVVGTKSWKDGVTDREPVWSNDGKFLFFASDRKENSFNVFRWNPSTDDAQSRTEGRASRGNPTVTPGDPSGHLLIVAGGFVRELDPTTGKTPQILPPPNPEIVQSGGGDEGENTSGSLSIYGELGNSFRIARYLPDGAHIAAVMRRDEGEVLVVQDLTPVNGRVPRPKPLIAGDRVDFDLDPQSGAVAFTVQNFKWPLKNAIPEEFRKDNRVTVPFRHGVGIFDPKTGAQVVVGVSADDRVAFGAPRVAPNGQQLLLVVGKIEEGSLVPTTLLVMPMRERGIQAASRLVQGEVYEPTWAKDGKRIAYAKRVAGKRDIFTMNADGSSEESLTKGKGNFATPLFSPQEGG